MDSAALALRFNWSLDYRMQEPSWPAPYRCRLLPNKQERQEYRLVGYGATAEEAIRAVVAAQACLDSYYARM